MKRLAAIFLTVATLSLCWMPKGFAATPTAPTEPDGCGTGLSWLVKFSRRATGRETMKTIKVGNQEFTIAQLIDAISKVYPRWEANGRLRSRVTLAYVEQAITWAITERKPKDERHEPLPDDDACGPPDGHANTEDVLIDLIDRITHAQEVAALSQVACGPAIFVDVAIRLIDQTKQAQQAALSHVAREPAVFAQAERQGNSAGFDPIDSSGHRQYPMPLGTVPISGINLPNLMPIGPLYVIP